MIKLINYKYDSEGEVIYLDKSSISEMKRIGKENMTHIWNKDSRPIEYVVKETPEEILAMSDIEEGNKVIDWEQRRYEIANGMLPIIYYNYKKQDDVYCITLKQLANKAVRYAEALITELNKAINND